MTQFIERMRVRIRWNVLGVVVLLFVLMLNSTSIYSHPTSNHDEIDLIPAQSNVSQARFIENNLLQLILGMEDANLLRNDVLLTKFVIEDVQERKLPITRFNASQSFGLGQFKNRLNDVSIGTDILINNSFLTQLKTELENVTSLHITSFRQTNLTKIVENTGKFIVLLWDKDRSVSRALQQIKQNSSLTTQPFTGDEVYSIIQLTKLSENFFGTLTEQIQWRYNDGSEAVLFRTFINFLSNRPQLARTISQSLGLDQDRLNLLRSFVGLESKDIQVSKLVPRRNTRIGFSISQLQIKNLELFRNPRGITTIRNLDYIYVEHQSMGLTIFNDTNANGLMDLGVASIASDRPGLNGTVVPTQSEESLYRVDFVDSDQVSFIPVTKDDSELSFGINISNVVVNLNPVFKQRDTTLLSDEHLVGGPQTLSNLGFMFHFTVDDINNQAVLKFDYSLGSWSNQTMLEGLSLNHMFITTVREVNSSINSGFRFTAGNSNAAVDTNADASSASSLSFHRDDTKVANIELDSIPYLWTDQKTPKNAFGQTIPLLYGQYLFGTLTAEAEIFHSMRAQTSQHTYLYSVSYPNFDGEAILHDPTYTMSSNVGSFSQPVLFGDEIVLQPAIERTNLLLGSTLISIVAIFVYILFKRRI